MIRFCVFAAAALMALLPRSRAAEAQPLWEIGRPDGANAEFALAPGGYSRFESDGFFVVGKSDASRDWPYVQPGPVDAWGGGTSHTFTVLFGLQEVLKSGECHLRIRVLDTHASAPPKLVVRINDHEFSKDLAGGAGDASVRGEPSKGKPQIVDVAFPASLLMAGDNRVQLTTTSGSWLLYDSVGLEAPAGMRLVAAAGSTIVDAIQPLLALREEGGRLVQSVKVQIRHFGAPLDAVVKVEGAQPATVHLADRVQTIEVSVPAVDRESRRKVVVEVDGRSLASRVVVLQPVRRMTVYILPHSHTDIGYTEIQTDIEKKQVENLRKGMEYARRTAGYPEGARFVWNVEVLWAADLYLHRLGTAERTAFLEAVRNGQVVLNGMYLNELTGLCRPEELVRLFSYATELSRETGVPIDSVMISDVPGYTWGTVTAMNQAGLRYFSTAPNYFDRIGDILQKWENRPFWWVGPSGKERVLVWIPYKGYAMSHVYGHLSPSFVTEYQNQLKKTGYPYDIAYMRWSGHGDNAEPDPAICEFVKDWNTRYAWPHFVISGTGEAFRAFEKRYGSKLPEVRGDWTPYWEDGAGSSALETAMNRESSDIMTQAEAIHAISRQRAYPVADFAEAWKKVLLYSEHTWGAWCSVSDPEAKATREQWAIKQSYALDAASQSRALLKAAIGESASRGPLPGDFRIINTASWKRSELAILPKSEATTGDRVTGGGGAALPSQRLTGGDLAFVTPAVAPFSSDALYVGAGAAHAPERPARATGVRLENGLVSVRLDPDSGAIVELLAAGIEGNLVDTTDGGALNEYLFLPGDKLTDLKRRGAVKIRVKENGPLVASLLVESEAPGCRKLTTEIQVVAGQSHVTLINTVDKERAATSTKTNDWQFAQKGGKESVNFGFAFRVPGGDLRLDLPIGVIRPEIDQMPSACKNWFTVGRWADVSGRRHGIEWVTLDAPLLQVGGLTATLVGSQANPDVWRKKVEPTQRIYSWVMNNHWGTNYRSYQEGPVVFRFVLRPHGAFEPAENSRFAIAASQPLLVRRSHSAAIPVTPRFRVEPDSVLVTGLKPSDDGRAVIVRLYGASGKSQVARLTWPDSRPVGLALSDASERALKPIRRGIEVPGYGVVTVRVEMPQP